MDFIIANDLKVGSKFYLVEAQTEVTVTQLNYNERHVVVHYNLDGNSLIEVVGMEEELPLTKAAYETSKKPNGKGNPAAVRPQDTKNSSEKYTKKAENPLVSEDCCKKYMLQSLYVLLFIIVFFVPLLKAGAIAILSTSFNDIKYAAILTVVYILAVSIIRITSFGKKDNAANLYLYDLFWMIIVTLTLFIVALTKVNYEQNIVFGSAPFIALAATLFYVGLFKSRREK